MVKTSAATVEVLRDLTVKVKNGTMTREEATQKAILALQEVAEKEPEEVESEDSDKTEEENAPATNLTPTPSVLDPKTRILSLLTQFEEAIQGSLNKLQNDITNIVKETEGAAVPMGDFSIGNDMAHLI